MSALVWAVILLLILVNALYVAAEFAAVGVRRSQVHQLAQQGNALARGLLPTLEDAGRLDRYIAACQIGITLSSLVLGAYGQATLGQGLAGFLSASLGWEALAAHSAAVATVLVVLTTLQVVFGELVPKSLALQFPTRLALFTYPPMRWSLALFRPFIVVLNGSGALLLRALGLGEVGGHRHIHSPEEIEMLLAESREGGLLEPEEQDRLRRALYLGRRTARQLMVPRRYVMALSLEAEPEEVLRVAVESPYTRLPVYRGSIDEVVGMIHTKDFAAFLARHGRLPALAEVLRPLPGVPSGATTDRLLAQLRRRRSRMAAVVDEYGGVEGIFTLEDVLAELFGDMADEFKGLEPEPEPLPDGRLRLPGRMRLDEAEAWVGARWEGSEADTLGGLVTAALGAIPQGGERLELGGVEIEVERMDGTAVASLLVRPLPPPEEEADNDEEERPPA